MLPGTRLARTCQRLFSPLSKRRSAAMATIGALDDGATWDGAFRASEASRAYEPAATSVFAFRAEHLRSALAAIILEWTLFTDSRGFAVNAAGPGIDTMLVLQGMGNMVTLRNGNGFTSATAIYRTSNVSIGDEIARGTP